MLYKLNPLTNQHCVQHVYAFNCIEFCFGRLIQSSLIKMLNFDDPLSIFQIQDCLLFLKRKQAKLQNEINPNYDTT